MKAIVTTSEYKLITQDVPIPHPESHEVLVKVKAFGINRADLLQKMGKYPPPEGVSSVLGLEISGMVESVGEEVFEFKRGDEVFGLVSGGGYAEYATVPASMIRTKPKRWSHTFAASIPEVFLTAYQGIRKYGRLKRGERVLIHAGASGVGTAAIQLARWLGAEIIVTASKKKHALCYGLGASLCIDYKTEDFESIIKEFTKGKGVHLVLDMVGGEYFNKNISVLAIDGRYVLLALLSGGKIESHLVKLLSKRIHIIASTLRSRTLEYQSDLFSMFWKEYESYFLDQKIHPVIDSVFSWNDIEQAHRKMEENNTQGKLIVEVQ